MQLDKTSLDRLLSLDDETLAKTIKMLAATTGINPRAAEAATKNLRLVRQSLSNATDADLKAASELIGKEKTETILRGIEEETDGQ
ncbi:MAG: hypothetical protein IJY93_02930 [Clostridia bacterium]|nr:hypothetical protein [Clostridia bacterium]